MVTPQPFITLRREVEWSMFLGLTTLICTALWLFALIRLVLQEVAMFLPLDEQIPKPEEVLLFCLLL